jgi:hypothetical protein
VNSAKSLVSHHWLESGDPARMADDGRVAAIATVRTRLRPSGNLANHNLVPYFSGS